MPRMDGLEATRRIRAVESVKDKQPYIIAVSAHVLPGDRERCLAAGMNDFVAKPIELASIHSALQCVRRP